MKYIFKCCKFDKRSRNLARPVDRK